MSFDVLLVLLLAVVTVSLRLARLVHLPVPTTQFLSGCVIALLPGAGAINVSPDLILLVVLPLILFWEGYQTSPAWARRYWRPIMLNGLFLVVLTAGAVAVIAHLVGFSWPAAWALGAVIAPTDASAVAAFGSKMPTSWVTALRGESLINDGTALVILTIAIDAASGKRPGLGSIALQGVQSYGVGIVVGLAVTAVMIVVLPRVRDASVNGSLSLLLPFLAAVPAEALHGSGVVAVVTCGLIGSRSARRITEGRLRLPVHAFWDVTSFVLTGTLFVIGGVAARGFFGHTGFGHLLRLTGLGIGLAVLALAVRFIWVNAWTAVLRTVDRRPQQHALRVPFRARFVTVWAGLRGSISIAAALTVPQVVGGQAFDHRNDVLIVTFAVVAFTLFVQGSTLGRVVRWASAVMPESSPDQELHDARQALARYTLTQLGDRAAGVPDDLLERLRTEADNGPPDNTDTNAAQAELRVLALKRNHLGDMVRSGQIEDSVMWRVQELLDIQEVRLHTALSTRPTAPEPAS